MLEILAIFPVVAGFLMLLAGKVTVCRFLLVNTALVHFVCSLMTCIAVGRGENPAGLGGIIAPDALGCLFLILASTLFLMASIYGVGYLREEEQIGERKSILDGKSFANAPERRFTACLCFFLAAMTVVTTTRHLGAFWVGIEVTTLSSAPLIYFHQHRFSLEATWKYLIICSVGIALALLGNILLTVAFHHPYVTASQDYGMNQMDWFLANAQSAGKPWLKAAFVFLLVGYGTKMGLAPLHNWLPDAHSQAPSLASGLLSGALLNCAFLGILRGHQILLAGDLGQFSSGLFVFFGLLSLAIAAVFIVGQGHYKRLLAYSSVEHMGILALAVGLGGMATRAAMLHATCHSMIKCMLFLVAGNILARYHTYSSYDVRGMRWTMPFSGVLWTAGFLAVAGSPPFGIFVSEFMILKQMFASGSYLVACLYLAFLAIIFVGMSIAILRMVQGAKPVDFDNGSKEPLWSVLPPLLLGLTVLTLGIWVPDCVWNFMQKCAALIGG